MCKVSVAFVVIYSVVLVKSGPVPGEVSVYQTMLLQSEKCPYLQSILLKTEPSFLEPCTKFSRASSINSVTNHNIEDVLCLIYYNDVMLLCITSTLSPRELDHYLNESFIEMAMKNYTLDSVCEILKHTSHAVETIKDSMNVIQQYLGKSCKRICSNFNGEILPVCSLAAYIVNMSSAPKLMQAGDHNAVVEKLSAYQPESEGLPGNNKHNYKLDFTSNPNIAQNHNKSEVNVNHKNETLANGTTAHAPDNTAVEPETSGKSTPISVTVKHISGSSKQMNHASNDEVHAEARPEIDSQAKNVQSKPPQTTLTNSSQQESEVSQKSDVAKQQEGEVSQKSDVAKQVIGVETKVTVKPKTPPAKMEGDNTVSNADPKQHVSDNVSPIESKANDQGTEQENSGIDGNRVDNSPNPADIPPTSDDLTDKMDYIAADSGEDAKQPDDIKLLEEEKQAEEITQPEVKPKKPKPEETDDDDDVVMPASYNNQHMDEDDSYFFSYFMMVCAVFILAYVAYHNKQKVFALVLEGRRGKRSSRSRRPNSANYHKLDSNLEEAVTSSCNKNTTNIIY